MKSFRVKFIGALLLLAMALLIGGLFGVYGFSKLVLAMYPQFYTMHLPMLVLCEGIVLLLILALGFGFLALLDYGRGEIFHKKMLLHLQLVSLAFVGVCLLCILAIIFTDFNLDGSITNLIFLGGLVVALLLSQIFLLLADLIRQGMVLKEENDLTI